MITPSDYDQQLDTWFRNHTFDNDMLKDFQMKSSRFMETHENLDLLDGL